MLKLLLTTVFLFPMWAFAAPVTFRDILPRDEEHVKKTLPHLLSEKPELADMDDALRILMQRGAYENVFIERNSAESYVIIGKPLRQIEEIIIHGASAVSESELRGLIDFKVNDRFDRKKAVAAAEKMKNYYGEHGFFNTVIELNFQKSENKNIRLVFEIEEKPPCLVKGLLFTTPNTDLKNLLDANFGWMIDKPLTTERTHRLMQDLNNLLVDGRYLSTEVVGPDAKYNPEKTEAYMQLEVREPYRWEFYFSGNSFFSDVDVYHALDLRNRERKNIDPAGEGAERLRRAYLDRGFPNVQIETRIENPSGTYLKRVHYAISEGPRVKIKAIEVLGRISRSSNYYQDFILKNSSDLVNDGYYSRADLDTGFKNLVTDLRNQGYLHARVLSSRIDYNDSRNAVTVHLLLEEGSQTQVRGLDFVGNKYFSSFELAGVTGLETNTPLKLNRFEDSLRNLKDFYHNQGFLEMKLLNESEDLIRYNDKGTQARIVFQIYEGPRIRVNSIKVEGNVQTKTSVILKAADLQIGEVLTPQKVDDASVRLNRLGLFSRADIHTLEEGTNVSERTLIISVSERDPGVFRVGGGVTNERNFTVRAFTAASYNNLGGDGRAVTGRAEVRENVSVVQFPENELTVGYLEPFLFNTHSRGRVNLTRSQYVYDYETEPAPYTEITVKNRVDFLVERDLTQHTRFIWKTWSLESRQDYERAGRCLPNPLAPLNSPDATFNPSRYCSPTVMQVSTVGPEFDIDYRDNPFLPTRGSFTRFVLDYSNPNLGSSKGVEFIKADAAYTYYLRLGSPRWVWANSFHTGYLSNLSRQADSGVPSDYSFVLGGIYTLRGYDYSSSNERLPRDGDGLSSVHNEGFQLGTTNEKLITQDSHYYLIKTELRFPLYGDFGGVLFYDGAAVYVTSYDFARPYQDAAGFGFRYNTPVGPVALDFAFKIHPQPVEYDYNGNVVQNPQSAFRFYFSIGTF